MPRLPFLLQPPCQALLTTPNTIATLPNPAQENHHQSRSAQRKPNMVLCCTVKSEDAIEWPIDGVLDLHLFRPAEVKDLVPAYLEECRGRGISHVRVIHGKGTGALRETVHGILKRTPGVRSFGLAPATAGGWGATVVQLESGPNLPDARRRGYG